MEYIIKTNRENRREIRAVLIPLGTVTDNWTDGSFSFRPYDDECVDEMADNLDKFGIEYTLS